MPNSDATVADTTIADTTIAATTRRELRSRRRSGRRLQLGISRRSRLLAFGLAPVLALTGIGLGVLGATTASAALPVPPSATIELQQTGGQWGDADEKDFILAGEDATFDVSLTNESGTAGFNIAFTIALPLGIDFSASPMGTPVVYTEGQPLPNTAPVQFVPAGQQVWVFEDVSDLPATATYASTVTVRPHADVYPVGASPDFVLDGYVSSDATLKPVFPGATGVGGPAAEAATSASPSESSTAPVQAVRLTKSEPSPEIELLRGVHENQTTYTLTIENSPQGPTDDVTVVDYIPAGLEFLGCATDDNTLASPLLFDDGTREYPGAGPITGPGPVSDAANPGVCLAPSSVETVDSGIPAGLPAGVYTRVEWRLSDLAQGTPQNLGANAAGVPSRFTIIYAAAVPLFENTMTFVTDAGSGSGPAPASGEQGSNLNNNNGASTRQGQGPGFGDGIEYRNTATVAGTYAGPVTAPPATAASDTDTERIDAMDLRILKSVSTGSGPNGNDFVTGGLATFALNVHTSEYTSADRIEIVDTLPNGLCPALPVGGATLTGDPFPAVCEYPDPAGTLDGATVTAIDYDAATGQFQLTFALDVAALAQQTEKIVTYTALMRPTYDTDDPWSGPTSSGDDLTNTVDIRGWTDSIGALDGVTNGSGVPAFGEKDVFDDSAATIVSAFSKIDKRVLPRNEVVAAAPATAADSCDVAPSGPWQQTADATTDIAFTQGDVVCYELTVDYAHDIDVRNPVVTDFLPNGVEYVDAAAYFGPGGTTVDPAAVPAAPSVAGKRLQWLIGVPDGSGDRFVTGNTKLVLHVLGRLTSNTPNTSDAAAPQDKPENLLKYQQENVQGELYFLRDASGILAAHGPRLTKDVDSVNGSPYTGANVRGGDNVSYRVAVTGGDTTVTNLSVWDALPEGIDKLDVGLILAGGTALDPGDPGYPTSAALSGRSVIVWTGLTIPADNTVAFFYTVNIPADVAAGLNLENTASITQYDVELNTGETETFYPDDSLDTDVPPGSPRVPGDFMRDDADVDTQAVSVAKQITASEITTDPNNGLGDAVEGEIVTWQYSVTIPARTTVLEAVFRDAGVLRDTATNQTFPVTITDSSYTRPAGVPATGFTFEADPAGSAKGVLTFPSAYTNATASDQVFTVTLSGWVDAGASQRTLRNTASFLSDTSSGSASADLRYVDPNPQISKSANPNSDVSVGEDITYTVRVENGPNRPISYDNVIVDTVPAGLDVNTASFTVTPASFSPGIATGLGGTITWNVAEIPPSVELQYTAQINPVTGSGQTYTNSATVVGYTLPSTLPDADDRRGERDDSTSVPITAIEPTLDKTVRAAGYPYLPETVAPVGATVDYRVEVALPAQVNFYEPIISDQLPAGVTVQGTPVVTVSDPASIPGDWDFALDPATNVATWTYDGDITAFPAARTVTVTYSATLTSSIPANATTRVNDADFTWALAPGGTDREEVSDTARTTILNPVLAIQKSVTDTTPDPGQTFTYTVRVTNTGDTPAYNTVITDAVPAGVVVDASTITGGGTLSGSTITWDAADLPGPLYQGGAGTPTEYVFTYEATLAASGTLDGSSQTNTATVDRFESFPSGGREYTPGTSATATVTPAFPFVTLQKAATSGALAYVDEPFTWTLTLRNTGTGPAQTVWATDVLPPNWTYDDGSAQVSVGGAPATQIDPTVTTAGSGDELVWNFGSAAPAPTLLPASGSSTDAQRTITIVFTATPDSAALVDPGFDDPHVNLLTAVTTDTTNETSHLGGEYTGPDATAETRIDEADVAVSKVGATTALVAGGPAATAWTITVSNDGPDAAVGPFTVTDDWGTLPAGFTVTGFSGTGWSCVPASDGFTCERTNPADTLAPTTSFPPITVSAQVAADFDPADAPVSNTATVSAKTYDPDDDNNTSTDDVDVSFSADLVMTKTAPGPVPNAGGSLTWTLDVRNEGPSVSRSVAGKLITVTDTIPAGVKDVTVGALPPDWTVSGTGPFQTGDTVTFTLPAGDAIAASTSVSFFLTGTVDPALAPAPDPANAITNAATVNPGETTDPNPVNNTDDVTVDPTTNTTIDVSKTRVVSDGAGGWVPATQPVTPGDPVTYLVAVANTGTADARGVTVTDTVEDYLTYSSFENVTGTWTRTSTTAGAGDDQTFTLGGNLAPAATASLVMTFVVSPAQTDDVENTVTASADNAPNDSDSTNSGSTRSVDLEMVKSHTAANVKAGESLQYTLTVTNEGPSDTSGPIVVTDTLPAGFSYDAGTAEYTFDGGASTALEPVAAGQALTWSIGTSVSVLPVGGQVVITFTADVAADVAASTYINTATVDGPDADPNPGNDTSNDPTVVVTEANLSLTKTADAGPYIAGENVTYRVTVTNPGPSVARNVNVSDTLPAGLTATSISGPGWTCDVATVSCDRADLAVGSSEITIVATIAANVLTGTVLNNVATVTSPTDPDTSDNTGNVNITVTTEADLRVVKTAVDANGDPITTVDAGTQLRYLFEVTNDGPSDAVGPLVLADTLPAGFTFVSIADGGSAWTATVDPSDAQKVTFTSASGLAAGASAADLVIVVAVDSAQPVGAAKNTVVVSSQTPDPDPSNDTGESTVDVTQLADLAIVKSHDAAAVKVGQQLVFDLAVTNDGPSDATTVTVIDTIPAGLEYVDASTTDPAWTVVADPVAADGTTTVTATLAGSLVAGTAAPVLRIAVLVHPEAYDAAADHIVTNVATVSADQPDGDPTNDTSQDEVTVPPLSSLTVAKTAVGAFQAGSNATYRITVTNAGPTADPGPITITDALPGGMRYVSASGDGTTCTAASATVTCTVEAPLAVGASATVTLVVALHRGAYPEVTNTATLTTPTEQVPNQGALSSTVTTSVAADPLALTGTNPVLGFAWLAALLVIAGILLLIARRRRLTA